MNVSQLSGKGEEGGHGSVSGKSEGSGDMKVFQPRVRRGAGASISDWCSATSKAAIHLGKIESSL